MKIILDDQRVFPDGPYNCVRTYEDCVRLLRIFRKVSFLSLDYDLGSDKTGLDVLIYMHENNITAERINIHSDHSAGRPKMCRYVEEHFPETNLMTNPL
ncbi:MAG: hypothetical protein IKC03_02345 [Oscillospiraceae bacterium]|nr:hypothetical protein [Oscillospiraceae bacterium]